MGSTGLIASAVRTNMPERSKSQAPCSDIPTSRVEGPCVRVLTEGSFDGRASAAYDLEQSRAGAGDLDGAHVASALHTACFEAHEQEAANLVFGALSHPSRRHILMVLRVRGGKMTAGEIANRFACSWPTTTRHLRVLEEAGLVTIKKCGRERIYCLDVERLQAVTGGWLKWFEGEKNSTRCNDEDKAD